MFNSALLSPRNILVIAVFAVVAQIVFSKVHNYLQTRDKVNAPESA